MDYFRVAYVFEILISAPWKTCFFEDSYETTIRSGKDWRTLQVILSSIFTSSRPRGSGLQTAIGKDLQVFFNFSSFFWLDKVTFFSAFINFWVLWSFKSKVFFQSTDLLIPSKFDNNFLTLLNRKNKFSIFILWNFTSV